MKKNILINLVGVSMILALTGCGNVQQSMAPDVNVNEQKTGTETSDVQVSDEGLSDSETRDTKTTDAQVSDNGSSDSESNTDSDKVDGSNTQKVNSDRRRQHKTAAITYDSLEHFEVTSESSKDGVWDDEVSNTNKGSNTSPELKWEAVDGANYYAVYMIDGSWLHMEVLTDKTELAKGEIDGSDDNKYVGPYPPNDTHTYNVYVVALKNKPGKVSTSFDSSGNDINFIISDNDKDEEGNEGNVISAGLISSTYSTKK